MLMNGTQQQRFNVRLKFRSRMIHFDSLIARGKSHQGVPKSDTKAFNPESNFHLYGIKFKWTKTVYAFCRRALYRVPFSASYK